MRSSSLLALVVATTTALVGALVVGREDVPVVIRAVFGGTLLLYLSGFAVTEAFFAGRAIERVEHVALSLGLSICLGVLGGFLLHATGGLDAASWGALLGGTTIAACAIAAVRAPGRGAAGDRGPAPRATRSARASLPDAAGLAMFAAAGLVAVSALLVARMGVEQQPRPGFTQLWVVRDGGDAMTVGISNAEGAPETFRVAIALDGEPLTERRGIELTDGRSWTETMPIPELARPISSLEVRLFRAGDEEPYRTASLALRRAAASEQGSSPP